ncbi:MAG: hypothetical protein M3436_07565 [Pseudomonadota bacterium]|nr:hypothetical protein [Pseudomonadota bacterium]
MNEAPRKKSPRAPSLPLGEAIERALRIYEQERRHAALTDVIAQNLGYKSANSGSALSAIASLRYYGLLEKAQEGKLAVSKDVESFRFTPNELLKDALLLKWLKSPQVFAELLDRYEEELPSDATLRFNLIERGFTPGAAESLLGVFRKSVEFAKYYERKQRPNDADAPSQVAPRAEEEPRPQAEATNPDDSALAQDQESVLAGYDRIPVRLAGGRRAWLEIPSPFYSADKKRLKAQIDLLLTEDDEDNVLPEE